MIDWILTIPCIALCVYVFMDRLANNPIGKREAIFAAVRIGLLSTLLTIALAVSLAFALHLTTGLDPKGLPSWFGPARMIVLYTLALGVSPTICTFFHLKSRMSLGMASAGKVALGTGLVTVIAFPLVYVAALLILLPFAFMGGLAMSANASSIARNSVR